jgi:hypothetical protein
LPHLWPTGSSTGWPPRLRPGISPHAFRIPPRDGPLPSGVPQEAGSRSALAVSDFRLRARLGFTIPSFFPRPARHYPRFRIWRPSSKRQRDFNPPDLGAAQHTLQASPSPHRARPYPRGRPFGPHAQTTRWGFPCCRSLPLVCMPSPIPRRNSWVPVSLTSPEMAAFPESAVGSASASPFSRPAQRSLPLRPAYSPSHQT